GFACAGLQRIGVQFDGEMAVGWTPEWAVRIPFILCGIACVWATWELTRRLAGRRAGLWAAVSLATASQFYFVSRQAMTDMAFVAPIAGALAFAGLAFMLPREETEAPLERRSLGFVVWSHTPSFYVLVAMVLLVGVPQLVICSAQAPIAFTLGRRPLRMAGVVGMLPWIGCLLAWLGFVGRAARNRKQIYL